MGFDLSIRVPSKAEIIEKLVKDKLLNNQNVWYNISDFLEYRKEGTPNAIQLIQIEYTR